MLKPCNDWPVRILPAMQTTPPPHAATPNAFALPENHDYLWDQLRQLPYFRGLLRAVESRYYRDLPVVAPVLDLGSGDGVFAQQTFAKPLDVGIDPFTSPTYGEIIQKGHKAISIAAGAAMPFPTGSFQTVISNSVLEHIPNLEPVIAETFRVLRPGGHFLFCSPSDCFDRWFIGGALFGAAYRNFFQRISRHHHCDSPATWQARLERQGFEVERIWYYFSPHALRTLELGHYFGAPSLITRRLFGEWVLWPSRNNPVLRALDAVLRPIYNEGPVEQGAYLFGVARKPISQP